MPGGRRRFALLLALVTLVSALLGAGVLAAILLATGDLNPRAAPEGAEPVTLAPPPERGPAQRPAALYALAAPGVVTITARGSTTIAGPFGPLEEESTAAGAGTVLDRRGRILTADHLVRGATSIRIAFADGASRHARILGHDATTDLAVLAVDPSRLTLHPLALGISAALRIGDPVAAIGDPFGYPRSLSTGVVSGLDRTIQGVNGFSVAHAIQTDAAIDPGNSGGPLLDDRGRVIGVVDQIAVGNLGFDSSTGVGFAVSSDVAHAELPDLVRGVTPVHAYLGVGAAPAVGADVGPGVVVAAVDGGSPADVAGVRATDVIATVDGRALRGVNDLVATVSARRPGQALTLGLRRQARRLTLRIALAPQPTHAPSG